MRLLPRILPLILLALIALIPAAPATSQEPTFSHAGIARDADRYEAYLKSNWKAGRQKPAELRAAGENALATDPRAASRSFAMAVVADDKSSESWLGLARALLAIKPDPGQGAERYDLPMNASGAAYRAYQRAGDQTAKARALAVLGEALAQRSYWRPALEALKASLTLADNSSVRQTYDKLRAEHGFRMTDYKADTNASPPRVCLQFSERLTTGQADLAKFASVNGRDPQGVSAEGSQLCIEGLAHGDRYEIHLRAGLPSDVGEVLEKPVDIAVYLPDRKPFVRFTGKSYVLPSRGQQGIPLVSVNTDKIDVEIFRVGDRNLAGLLDSGELQRQLSTYDAEMLRSRTGERVYKGTLEVPAKLNQEVTTAFPLSDAIGTLKPGAYAMVAKPEGPGREGYEALATQWFVVSDLGLTALTGDDGAHVFVRSLADASPVAGAKVRLVARNNEVLATLVTDANGYARFDAGLTRGEGGLQPAILVAEKGEGGEYAFLDLTTTAFDLSDRGVKGREPPGPFDGFLYTERGVYRPGEDVNITALLRDRVGKAATLPATLIVTRPDGVEHRRTSLPDQGLGGRSLTLALGSSAMTGTWRARLHTDPKEAAIAQVSFLVEDFVPERLDLRLEPAPGALKPEEPFTIKAAGRYLYGPPAQNLALEGDIIVRPSAKEVPGYSGYRFGLEEERIDPVRKPLEGLPKTDAEGKAQLAVSLPAVQRTARPLEASVLVRLRETGGRTIERSLTLPVDLGQPRIGVKPLFQVHGLGEDETAAFDVVLLDGAAQREAAQGLRWTLVRLDTSWQWYSRDGHWAYEAVTLTRKVASGTVDVGTDAPARIEARVGYGRYRLDVASAAADGPATSVVFNAGWYTGGETADSPEALDVALDKPSYRAGETAKLRIASKRGGRALVTVLAGGMHFVTQADVPNGGGEVAIPVGSDWGSGAYAVAFLYRPMDEKAKRMPARAIGVKWLQVDQSARALDVAVAVPDRVKSGATLNVPVKITGLGEGESARVTVAAVDLGVLNLTRYQAPAPERWFYAQQRLGLEIRDFYGRLIDGMRAERGKLRSGGDADGGMAMQGSPPVEETVSLFSGIVEVGAGGTASVEFPLPEFNGTVRVMAVAWSADKLGHATADVIVRDAVALTASGPRFLTLGDEARLELDIHNVEGPAADYALSLTGEPGSAGAKLVDRTIALKAGERKAERITVKPADVGLHSYAVRVTGPNGIEVKRRLTFDVKPPAGDIKRTTVSQLAPGGRLILSQDLVHDMIAGRTRINLSVGPTAALDVPALLTQLDRYPYGCAEQTVSRALPLVYANAVAAQIGLGEDKELKARVQGAIDRVFEMQDSSGAFGAWGPSYTDMWLTSYVTDFLTRAREAGYTVRPQGFRQALDRLQNFIAYAQDFERGGESRAYALYVLARNGRAPIGELRYYADTRIDRFSTPLAKAQLGAALAMMGDKVRADRVFGTALASFDEGGGDGARSDYGSRLRDGAALVTLASETRIARDEAPRLVDVIAKAYRARTYTSTQEQAWMLLAVNGLAEQAKATRLSFNGAPVSGSLIRGLSPAELKRGEVAVVNNGDAPVDAVISVVGAALTPEPPASKGFRIERSYYTLDGKKVDLGSAAGGTGELQQNERLVAVLKVEAQEAGGRVLLVDRLPAGFEIENPRLLDSGDIKSLDWLKTTVRPEHTEFRDDRFVAAFNLFGNGRQNEESNGNGDGASKGPATTATVAYMVRAVTPGTFVHPAATVEDMYRPERYARTAAGKLSVIAKQ